MKNLIEIRNKMLAEVEQIEGNEMLKISLKFTINELDTWIYKKSEESKQDSIIAIACDKNDIDGFLNRDVIDELSNEETDTPHYCPYKGDIEGDYDTLCNCSPYQMNECARDI